MMRNKEVTSMIKLKTKGVTIPLRNKSTLAKLLSNEDIFVVHKQMETAYFNSKSRELGLPIWLDEAMTKDIYDLMVCHEIGHALWTPLDMLESAALRKINFSFVNILEDARIERFVKDKYAGTLGVFNRGYKELVSKDFFGTADKDVSKLNLIDRINLFFKGNSDITFSKEEKVWVDRTAKTKTPIDVLDLAEELYKWMEENESETDNHNNGENGESMDSGEEGEGTSSGEKSEGEENGDSDNNESGDKSESSDDGDAGSDDTSSKGEVEENDENSDKTGSGVGDSDNSESDDSKDASDVDTTEGGVGDGEKESGGATPKATTDTAFGKAMDDLRDKLASNRTYVNIPKLDISKIVVPVKKVIEEFYGTYVYEKSVNSSVYWDACLNEVELLKDESKKTVGYMVKEFEMKKAADQYARAATSKTGSLDMSKLHTYKYNEDLFKKVTTLPGATDHGMVMVLDWSGSMNDNLKGTISQLFNLVWFCRKVKIPFTVLAFSDMYTGRRHHDVGYANEFKCGDLRLNSFSLLELFTSNMNTADEMKMMHTLLMYANRYGGYRDWNVDGYPYSPNQKYSLGGTPLNDAIIAMMEYVPQFKLDSGVQKVHTIFLTDGASHSIGYAYDYKLITEGENKGSHEEDIVSCGGNWRDRNLTIYKDSTTGKTYDAEGSNDQTSILLKILKERVGNFGNLVNFFIAGSGRSGRVDKRTLQYMLPSDSLDMIMEKVKFINKNKYLAIESVGFDVAYVLPGGNALAVENSGLSDDLVGATKAKLKTAFGKSMKSKIESRQLLNKFIAMVA